MNWRIEPATASERWDGFDARIVDDDDELVALVVLFDDARTINVAVGDLPDRDPNRRLVDLIDLDDTDYGPELFDARAIRTIKTKDGTL